MRRFFADYRSAMIEKYAWFAGRMSRGSYWRWIVVNLAIFVLLAGATVAFEPLAVLTILYLYAAAIPNWAATVRRLHDLGRSGWAMLVSLIPLIGPIIVFLMLASEGDRQENRFGPVPAD